MQATSNGTTQTQTHRSHGVGSNPENGGAQQLPAEVIAEVFSNLTLGEQTVAMSAVSETFRERVASHISEPSVARLGKALEKAAREGRFDEVQALLDRYQMANIPEETKDEHIVSVLTAAVQAGHVSIVRHILSHSQLSQRELTRCLLRAVLVNQPQTFRVVASYVHFSEILKPQQDIGYTREANPDMRRVLIEVIGNFVGIPRSHRDRLFSDTRNSSPEMLRVITEVIGPYFTDEQFQNSVGRPRRLSDSEFPGVNEPAGCLV